MVDITTLIKVTGGLGGLEFISAIIASVFIAVLSKSVAFCIILGIVLIFLGLAFGFFAFFHNDDPQSRSNFLTVAIPSFIIGITTCTLKTRWFLTANILTRAVIFIIIAFSICGALSFLFPIVTNVLMRDILDGANLDRTKEITLYVWCNFLLCFFYGLILASPKDVETPKMYKSMIVVGVANWFIGLVMFALVGILIKSKSLGGSENSSIYESAKAPITPEPAPAAAE